MNARGSDTVGTQPRDLIIHQRNQRRHNDCQALTQQPRHLIAQRFAAAGRHDGQNVTTLQRIAHDALLPGPKGIETEVLLERAVQPHIL